MSELFKLKNGTVLLSTEAPGGIYNSAQLKKIADLCSKELAIVKATEDQRLSLFVKETELDHVISELKATGLGFRNYQSGLHQPVSCLGELCETHDQPALTTAMDLTKLVAELNLRSTLKIGINGCATCCTPCHTLDISVIGEPSGYRISLGGKTSQFPELASFFAEGVPAKDLPRLITRVIEIFNSKAEDGETLNEVLDRCGVEDFIDALAPYSQDAATREDPFAVDTLGTIEASEEPSLSAPDEELMVSEEETEIETEADFTPAMNEDMPELLDLGDESGQIELEVEDDPEAEDDGDHLEESDAAANDEMSFDFSPEESGSLDEIPIITSAPSHEAMDDEVLLDSGDGEMPLDMEMPGFETESVLEMEAEAEPEAVSELEFDSSPNLLGDNDEVLDPIEDEPLLIAEYAEEEESASDQGIESIGGMAELEIEEELIFDDSALISEDLIEIESEPELIADDLEADVPLLSTEVSEIPELDEDLLQSNEIDSSLLIDDGEEGEMMSSEDEERFEQSIQASIEEDQKMRLDMEEDTNLSAREDAFRMLESAQESDIEPEAVPQPISSARSQSPSRSSFEFSGFDIEDRTMRVNFSSGAYIDVSLDTVDSAGSKVFRMGKQAITVSHDVDGYVLEIDGMKMFYPHQSMRVAS